MDIHENITEICRDQGISLSSVEEALGFGRGAISKWKTHSPGLARVIKVAEYLRVPLKEVIEPHGGKYRPPVSDAGADIQPKVRRQNKNKGRK